MSEMTPQQAADYLDSSDRAVGFTNVWHAALRVLIDHARAAVPEGGDLAARSLDLGNATVVEYLEAVAGDIADDAPVRSGRLRTAAEIVAAHRCAPSVAAPPREDEGSRASVAPEGGDLAERIEGLADQVGDRVEHYGREVGYWYWKLREIASAARCAPSVAAPPRKDEAEMVRKLCGALVRWKSDVASSEDRALLMEAAEAYVESLPAILAMPDVTPATAPGTVRDPERAT